MKHLLNDLSEQEKNAIREQHTGGMRISNEKFSKLIKSRLGDVKTLVKEEKKMETKESFWNSIFGKPNVDDAAHDSMRKQGWSHRGRDTKDKETQLEDDYIMFSGQKFYPDQIEYADYQDLGDLPRIEDGKLIVANPAWNM